MSRTIHRLARDGTIRDWLIGPAWSWPAGDLHQHLRADGSPWGPDGRWRLTNGPDATPLKETLLRANPPPAGGPVPAAAAEALEFRFHHHVGTWQRVHTAGDGLVDWSAFCFTPSYRLALAAATVEADQAEWRELRVASTGPVRLLLDGVEIGGSDRVSYMEPLEWPVRVWLPAGVSTLVAVVRQAGFRECRHILRVRVGGPPIRVIVPSPGADEEASARAEDLLDAVGLASCVAVRPEPVGADAVRRDAVGPEPVRPEPVRPDAVRPDAARPDAARPDAVGGESAGREPVGAEPVRPDAARPDAVGGEPAGREPVGVEAAGVEAAGVEAAGRGLVGAEAVLTGPDGSRLRVWWTGGPEGGRAVTLVGGRARVPLDGVVAREVSVRVGVDASAVPVNREFDLLVLPFDHRETAVGTPGEWRRELLTHASSSGTGVAAELARAELGGGPVTADGLARALTMISQRADCADFEAVGLLHLWHRADAWEPGLREAVRAALRGFKYWIDQPGLDAMCYFTENHQLVWHTAETLAGEALGDDVFPNTGWTGRRHAEHGRELAREWIARRLAGGFSEFDSNAYLAIDLLALVSLAELGTDRALAEAAAGLADRVLFSLAANSWRGVHGCAHGRSYVGALRSSRLEETAPIMRLCFGVGALNDALLPATVLAVARRYAVPDAIRAVAAYDGDWSGRQNNRGRYLPDRDLLDRPYGSDVVVHRTADVMLASVQDYRCGLPGLQEHVWGATLGPETQIFVTQPPNASVSPSSRPNAWAGDHVLPRVRQHGGTLIALYTGRTHAWFPVRHLDEQAARGVWRAGRRGDGYVALATDGGAGFATAGPEAWQELLPGGTGAAWVCVVGRRATHGSFAAFLESLPAPEFGPERARFAAPGGPLLDLPWTGPFTVNGRVEAIAPGPRISDPACALRPGDEEMTIAFGDASHRIHLRTGRPLPP
ncbi:hypothetical protein J2S43_001841 [Catenuloplanes nepalensis]|uniref:Heparinase II/III-like protein n=1 Tax=Catenuloplanes nepalensis TaxID=587533 RepID=A0ABT9MPH7_9ACTN|nr:hypothetical protein [Catenuloplanes nepalensis]MDP9793329.1 hypothetical protein [Catenuloplanes nepalensis]